MSETRHLVALQMLHRGERAKDARAKLAEALGEATLGEPDDTGTFEVEVPAASFDEALQHVWDALAASGADDHIVFLEHPGIPGHWRLREEGGGATA